MCAEPLLKRKLFHFSVVHSSQILTCRYQGMMEKIVYK